MRSEGIQWRREPARGKLVMRALLWHTDCAVKLLCTFLQERHKGGPQTSSQGLRLSSLGTKNWLPQWYWSPDKHTVGVGLASVRHTVTQTLVLPAPPVASPLGEELEVGISGSLSSQLYPAPRYPHFLLPVALLHGGRQKAGLNSRPAWLPAANGMR